MSKTKKERKEKKRIKLRNKKLIKKYPWLLPLNVWTRQPLKDYDYSWTEWDAIPKGWRIAFGDMFLKELGAAIGNDYFFIEQIKEKYGELRMYAVCTKKAQEVIDKYMVLSRNICIDCGRPDVPSTKGGWILPLCRKCYNGNNYDSDMDIEHSRMQDEMRSTSFKKVGDETIKVNTAVNISDTAEKIRIRWAKHHRDLV